MFLCYNFNMKYYKAYEERYKTYHSEEGKAWAGDRPSYILGDLFEKHIKDKKVANVLEIGCGEGQNAIFLMQKGYNIEATDVSKEAINWCKKIALEKHLDPNKFFVLDALNNKLRKTYDLIYSISTLHMLVLDEDRKKFLDFIYSHLTEDGLAIISVMGDGIGEKNNSDITKSFNMVERVVNGKTVSVAQTSCRIVNWKTLFQEIVNSKLMIIKHQISKEISGFNSSMVVIVKKLN